MGGCGVNVSERKSTADSQQRMNMLRNRPVEVVGCLQAGVDAHQFVLGNARLGPIGEQPSDAAATAGLPFTAGGSVQLTSGPERELERNIGQEVAVWAIVLQSERPELEVRKVRETGKSCGRPST